MCSPLLRQPEGRKSPTPAGCLGRRYMRATLSHLLIDNYSYMCDYSNRSSRFKRILISLFLSPQRPPNPRISAVKEGPVVFNFLKITAKTAALFTKGRR